jgi:hypothetical protein
MRILILAFLTVIIQMPAVARQSREYHAVVSSTRTYMDVSRETKTEYWFTKGKTFISNGRINTIVRDDLGVVYTLIVKSNVYYVDTIKPGKTKEPAPKDLDFRYIGVDRYTADYDWNVTRNSHKDTSGIFTSAHYVADGDADFDQVLLEYWVAQPNDKEMSSLFREIQLNSMSYLTTRKPLIDLLRKNKSCIPVKIIELVDNPIAPPILNRIILEKLEPAEAPANIFDLPEGAKKAK